MVGQWITKQNRNRHRQCNQKKPRTKKLIRINNMSGTVFQAIFKVSKLLNKGLTYKKNHHKLRVVLKNRIKQV